MLIKHFTRLAVQADVKGFPERLKKSKDLVHFLKRDRILGLVLSLGFGCQMLPHAAYAQLAIDKAQGPYAITDLGSLTGSSGTSFATALNRRAQVVGYSDTLIGGGFQHAFLYSERRMRDLGTLGGGFSYANGINDFGKVVGYSYTATGEQHAFLYTEGQMHDLGTLGGNYSQAFGVNNLGQVVGISTTASGEQHAFFYSDRKMQDINSRIPNQGWVLHSGTAISDRGQIVGVGISDTVFGQQGFLYSGGQVQGFGAVNPTAINDHGQVVGYDSVGSPPFLYTGGQIQFLPTLGFNGGFNAALGLNKKGQVVGTIGNNLAFLYTGGQMLDLNTLLRRNSGWTVLQVATDINDEGQIVGYGFPSNLPTHAFLLTPKE